ncbi:protein FAM151A [Rhinophrynus dorsalis]
MRRCSVSDLRTVAGACVFLGVCIMIAVLCLTLGQTPNKGTSPSFHTGSDMLDYLLSQGEINSKDGLLVSWYHGANNKSQMEAALNSDIMILEADVNVEGRGTPNETDLPIMAHPPSVYSDNTLKNWLNAVLASTKGIKLDFKSIQAVGPSLDVLRAKSAQVPINRPVWLNADIVIGPNVNHEIGVNASQFLKLVQEKFPDITISPGWVTLYLPPLISNKTYTQEMIQQMYDLVKALPQRITFPARAVLTRSAWPHFSWLLQQSDRYSLTLWQGTSDPLTLEDLLFIRDNSYPEKIYYDIYEPLLSEFKQVALAPKRKRLFYSGGSLELYFRPEDADGLLINWYEAEADISSVLRRYYNNPGMLTFHIDLQRRNSSLIPVVILPKSSDQLALEDCMVIISASTDPWGVFLKIKDQVALNETLSVLKRLYDNRTLYVPVWISMDVSYGRFTTPGYIPGKEFINIINAIFPFVTIAPRWPVEALGNGYTEDLVQDMLLLCEGLWQEVSFQLTAVALGEAWVSTVRLLEVSPMYSLTLEHTLEQGTFMDGYKGLMTIRSHTENRVYYRLSQDYRNSLMTSIFTS